MTKTTTPPSPPTTAASSDASTEKGTTDAADYGEDPLRKINLLLGSKLIVTMTDGRVARGNFVCLDRLGNVVLDDVLELRRVAYRDDSSSSEGGHEGGEQGGNDDDDHDRRRFAQQRCYRVWDTERSLSQAVIPGDRLARVEIFRKDWERRIGPLERGTEEARRTPGTPPADDRPRGVQAPK